MFSINYVKPKYIMKKIVLLNIVLATLLMLHLQAQTNSDYTVQTRVVVNTSPPSISIRWPKIATGVTAYNIYRKEKTDQSWGNILGSTLGTDTIWTDTQVKIGETYEYNIQKLNGTTLLGISYLLSGIEIPVVHSRGKALIVVEAGLASAIPNELKSFMADINADGWEVLSTQVSKSDSIQKVKREIKRIDLEVGGINALILLGHIPVPYVMGYDLQPLVTVEEKKKYLKLAAEENWKLYFGHDPEFAIATVKQSDKGIVQDKVFKDF